jgi:hypoxanthine phosphoribosyltransferase
VVESFSPDFYLPDFDTYVELTTLRQPLVRKKNRKLRRLRELYPDIGIKLFYARDFRALMLKYGKFGLVDALSGTSGQMMPVTAIDEIPDKAADEPAADA